MKLCAISLTTQLNENDLAWPKIETLAAECDITRGYAGTLLKTLEKEQRLVRRKLGRGEVFPNPDPDKQFPVSPGQYLYYVTPKMYDEEINPEGVPLAILKPFRGGNACTHSKHHPWTNSCLPSQHHSAAKSCALSETNHVHSVVKSCSLGEHPLQEQKKNKQKEQFDAASTAQTESKCKLERLAKMFEQNEPFEPSVFREIINEAITSRLELPRVLSQKTQWLDNRKLISRDDNELILATYWEKATSIGELLENHDPITGKTRDCLEQVINDVVIEKSLSGDKK